MMWLKMGNHSLGAAIDLCDLGLDAIEETDEAVSYTHLRAHETVY